MTGNKGGKNNSSIQLTCVESRIAFHIFAKIPLYHSKVLFVLVRFMLVSRCCSQCLGTPVSTIYQYC